MQFSGSAWKKVERSEEEEEAIFDLSGVDSDDAIRLYLKEMGRVPF